MTSAFMGEVKKISYLTPTVAACAFVGMLILWRKLGDQRTARADHGN